MEEIPKTMRALVAYGPGDYRLEEDYPVPVPGPDEVLIKVEGCGICASDLKCFHGAPKFWGDDRRARIVEPPFIPGHEFIGRVAAVGSRVTKWKPGDRVAPEQTVPCEDCKFCKSGRYWMCQTGKRVFGFYAARNGGMAEYVCLPKGTLIHRLPESLLLKNALLVEPYGCAKHCVDKANIGCEDVVVISGVGTLGLGMITYAKKKSPKKLIALDIVEERLSLAREYGADMALNIGKEDADAVVRELTDGYGCDIYIEAAGHPSSVVQGLNMIRKQGCFVEFGVFGQETSVDWSVIGDQKELTILGAHLSPYCYPYVIEHISDGSLKTDGIIRTMLPISEWQRGFELAEGHEGDLRVAFVFE